MPPRRLRTPGSCPREEHVRTSSTEQQGKETKEREGKGKDSASCARPMQQAEIPGRSKHQEKGGFI